jgi:hypothetical protein
LDSVQDWTPSEQSTYGEAFLTMVREGKNRNSARRPTHVGAFTEKIVDVVSGHRPQSITVLGLCSWKVKSWFRSDRIAVGAGGQSFV